MRQSCLSLFLCLSLAAPLCCCGWQTVAADLGLGQIEEVHCPHCVTPGDGSDEKPHHGEQEGCDCMGSLVVRDLALNPIDLRNKGLAAQAFQSFRCHGDRQTTFASSVFLPQSPRPPPWRGSLRVHALYAVRLC